MLTESFNGTNITCMSNNNREINRSRIERIKSAFGCKTDAALVRELKFPYRTIVSSWVARGWYKTTELLMDGLLRRIEDLGKELKKSTFLIDGLLKKNEELETNTKKLESDMKKLQKKLEKIA